MADYYPLISRAVAGLEKNNGENRRALYERARAALIAQLRGVNPPLPETDITRERLALEESIRKVEAEAARQFDPSRSQSGASKPRYPDGGRTEEAPRAPVDPPPPPSRPAPQMPRSRATEFDRWQESTPVSAPPSPRPAVPFPSRAEAPVSRRPLSTMPESRHDDAMFEQARSVEPIEPPPPPRHPLRRSMNDRRSAADGLQDYRDVVEANEFGGASARAAPSARDTRDGFAPIPSTVPDYERRESRMLDPQPHDQDLRLPDGFQEPMLEPTFTGEEAKPAGRRMTRQPPPPSRGGGSGQAACATAEALIRRVDQGRRSAADRRRTWRRAAVAMAEHDGALSEDAHAGCDRGARRAGDGDAPEDLRPHRAGRAARSGHLRHRGQHRAGRGGRAEGRAVRRGSGRPATANGSSARRSGAPRRSRPAPVSRPSLRSAPTSTCPTASWR